MACKCRKPAQTAEAKKAEACGTDAVLAPSGDFTVTFLDGTVIAEAKPADTLEIAVRKIGVPQVQKVVEEQNLVFCKVPVISSTRDDKFGSSQRDLGDGLLLMTRCCSRSKKKFLDTVSDELGLGLKVDLGK